MNKLKKYIMKTYSQTFFPIFLTLFIITSIIYLVRISALTSVMSINFLELLTLYSYFIPTILFYTLPISIFISIALSLSKLSSEYELIVITSFGLNPTKILKLILPSLILVTIFLVINSLALIPKADYLYNTFKEQKKQEAQFNIRASEYGQEFGKWLLYVNEEKDGLYKDIVLYQQNNNEDIVIIAKSATLENLHLSLGLHLKDGKALKMGQELNQINFEKMTLYSQLKEPKHINSITDLLIYWSDINSDEIKLFKFNFSILLSLFPLISILFFISIGFYNPRYNKNNATAYSVFLSILFVVASQKLSKDLGTISLYILPTFWILFSYVVYRLKIKSYY